MRNYLLKTVAAAALCAFSISEDPAEKTSQSRPIKNPPASRLEQKLDTAEPQKPKDPHFYRNKFIRSIGEEKFHSYETNDKKRKAYKEFWEDASEKQYRSMCEKYSCDPIKRLSKYPKLQKSFEQFKSGYEKLGINIIEPKRREWFLHLFYWMNPKELSQGDLYTLWTLETLARTLARILEPVNQGIKPPAKENNAHTQEVQ
jgi:hypothetical protein